MIAPPALRKSELMQGKHGGWHSRRWQQWCLMLLYELLKRPQTMQQASLISEPKRHHTRCVADTDRMRTKGTTSRLHGSKGT
jgi:hypothetical protein